MVKRQPATAVVSSATKDALENAARFGSKDDESVMPEGWAAVRLQDICAINPSLPATVAAATKVSFVPMAAVSEFSGAIVEAQTREYREVSKGYTPFISGDVLWAKITPCMENGKAAIARDLVNGVGCGSTEFFVLRSNGSVLPELLHRFVRQPSYRQAARKTMNSAVGQARVPKGFLLETPFALPPVAEQRRIVARLETLEARSRRARAALDALPPLLAQARQSLLVAAFRGTLTETWRKNHPHVLSSDQWAAKIKVERKARWEVETSQRRERAGKDSEDRQWIHSYKEAAELRSRVLTGLPPSWTCLSAEGCTWEVTVGYVGPMKSQYVDSGIPFLRSQNVRANRFEPKELIYVSPAFHEALRKSALSPGDIGIVRSGAPGTACVIPAELETAINPAIR